MKNLKYKVNITSTYLIKSEALELATSPAFNYPIISMSVFQVCVHFLCMYYTYTHTHIYILPLTHQLK